MFIVRIQKVNSQLNQHLPVVRELDDIPCHTRSKGRYNSMAILHPRRCQSWQMVGRPVAQCAFDHRSKLGRTAMPGHSCTQMWELGTEEALGDLTTLISLFSKGHEKMD